MQDVKFIISVVRGFVVQGRDHAPDDLHVFCPNFYWQVLKSTFGDTKVYSAAFYHLLKHKLSYKRKLLTNFSSQTDGASIKNATIPISYVLLKKKRQFAVARPIISYSSFIF